MFRSRPIWKPVAAASTRRSSARRSSGRTRWGLSECVGPYILAEFPDLLEAFIDFLFSDEAQQLVAEAYLLPGRSDVQCESRTNLSDIPQLPTDWTKMMDVASATAAKLNSLCQ